jgi:hypothetical protein
VSRSVAVDKNAHPQDAVILVSNCLNEPRDDMAIKGYNMLEIGTKVRSGGSTMCKRQRAAGYIQKKKRQKRVQFSSISASWSPVSRHCRDRSVRRLTPVMRSAQSDSEGDLNVYAR